MSEMLYIVTYGHQGASVNMMDMRCGDGGRVWLFETVDVCCSSFFNHCYYLVSVIVAT